MKNIASILLLPLAAMAAEPAVELEPADRDPAWRLSIGFRAAPGVRTSAAVDARAAAAAARGVLSPAGHGGVSSSGAGASVSVTTEDLGSTTEGTTEADALAAAGFSGDRTRYEFANGYIDLDDGAGLAGETQNWHFESAEDFVDGAIRARTPFASTTISRTRTTRTETSGGSASASRSVSLREEWGAGLGDTSDEAVIGPELRLDRTVWENAEWGLDIGIGYTWFGDLDAFSIRGRAYSAAATERTTTTETKGRTRTTTTEATTSTRESGTVVTSLAQPEFQEPADYANADGSMGGGVADVHDPRLPFGYQMPVLTVSPDRFSTTVERDPTEDSTSSSTSVSESGGGDATSRTSSRTTRRTVDVRSEGTLRLQELRLGVSPRWKAAPWLAVRADLGLLATYSEIETTTRLSVDGALAATIRRDEDDWTLGGYAGLSLAAAATDRLELSLGAEARFPHKRLRFDDGVVSGSVELAEWSAFASVGWRF